MSVSDEQYKFYFDTIAKEKIPAVEISGIMIIVLSSVVFLPEQPH